MQQSMLASLLWDLKSLQYTKLSRFDVPTSKKTNVILTNFKTAIVSASVDWELRSSNCQKTITKSMDNTSNWISAADEVVAIRCKRMPKVYAEHDTWSDARR